MDHSLHERALDRQPSTPWSAVAWSESAL